MVALASELAILVLAQVKRCVAVAEETIETKKPKRLMMAQGR